MSGRWWCSPRTPTFYFSCVEARFDAARSSSSTCMVKRKGGGKHIMRIPPPREEAQAVRGEKGTRKDDRAPSPPCTTMLLLQVTIAEVHGLEGQLIGLEVIDLRAADAAAVEVALSPTVA